jgi:hypothetical protein
MRCEVRDQADRRRSGGRSWPSAAIGSPWCSMCRWRSVRAVAIGGCVTEEVAGRLDELFTDMLGSGVEVSTRHFDADLTAA